MRDLNFDQIKADLGRNFVRFNDEHAQYKVQEILKLDAEFLSQKDLGFIDYSFVMWHETLKPGQKINEIETRNRYLNNDSNSVIHVAIIDYLQEFNTIKKMESKIKKC